ncbi:serine/threonine protein kinase [Thermoleophilia bacterium SCSIO 60948]|nr:serine/threonine protein kinase [Thermoleophilia bacterium SCSIO 60948]
MDLPDRETGANPGVPGEFMLLRRGETLRDGRYVLERRLGAGGMAAVWLARDELLGRDVAIKLISEMIVGESAWMERFRREARVAAGLSHPNLVDVYDFEPQGPRPYLVMAHIPGGTLADRLKAGDPPEPRRLASELLAALEHMHAAGVLHRDVKTSNVMLSADGSAKLGDFGISRPRDAPAVTNPGQVLGSARYMAPEVMAGEEFTERADLYSTGIVLGELLRERPDAELEAIAAEMADDVPERRPASARQVRRRIEAAPAARGEDRTATTRAVAAPVPAVEPEPEPSPPPREPAVSEPSRRGPSTPPQGFVPPPPITRRSPLLPRIAAVIALAAIVVVGLVLALSGGGGESGSDSGGGSADSGGASSGSGSSGSSGSDSSATDSSGSGSGSDSGGGATGDTFSPEDVVPVPSGNNPDLAAQLDAEGKSLIDGGDPEAAIPILRRAVVASDPEVGDTYAFALYNLGNALRLSGRYREAVAVLEQRLEVPNQVEAVQAELDLAKAEAAQ